MLRIDHEDGSFELYSRQHRPSGGFPNGAALGWKRPPARRWGRWRALQLARSAGKRRSLSVQPDSRWRHADGVARELELSRELERRLGAQYGHSPRPGA